MKRLVTALFALSFIVAVTGAAAACPGFSSTQKTTTDSKGT